MADSLDDLFADSGSDDARAAANRAAKGGGGAFHAPGDTNLFGGSFTPFKDLWNATAADLGITTKRMRNDALSQAAHEQAVWHDTSSALSEEIARQRTEATNPNDVSQLRTMQTQLDVAGRMRQSSNPKIQDAGLSLFGKVTDQQRAFGEQQETQKIAADASRAAIEREVGSAGFSRMQSISGDLRSESSAFLKQREAWGGVNAALTLPPSAASDLSLIFTFMKVLDPQSVVREGEFATAQNASGVPNLMLTAYNNILRDGQRLTPDQRKAFYDQSRESYLQGANLQRERNGRYLERARSADVPEKYLDSLTIPVDLPTPPVDFGADGTPFVPKRPDGSPVVVPDDQRTDQDSTARKIGQAVGSGATTAGKRALDFAGGIFGIGGGSDSDPAEPLSGLRDYVHRRFPEPPPPARARQRGSVSGVIRRPVND